MFFAFDGSSRSQGGEAMVVLYVLDRMVTQEGVNSVAYHFKVFLQNLKNKSGNLNLSTYKKK